MRCTHLRTCQRQYPNWATLERFKVHLRIKTLNIVRVTQLRARRKQGGRTSSHAIAKGILNAMAFGQAPHHCSHKAVTGADRADRLDRKGWGKDGLPARR